jgi:hypothetical protein
MKEIKKLVLIATILIISALRVSACSVPVFRYALERWFVDAYPVFLMHDGVNTGKVTEAEAYLEEYEDIGAVYVRRVDLSDPKIKEAAEKRELPTDGPLPRMVVTLPEQHQTRHIVVDQEISEANMKALVDSPVRRELGRRIIAGDSAVWVLLESGDAEKDAAAEKVINEQIAQLTEDLELPEIAPQDMRYITGDPNALRIGFSVIRLSRQDPNEKVLIDQLLNSEPDLDKYSDQPIAFPVFGRGRALFALVGEGINEDNIAQACYFLTGSCSCEVKAMNPGMDLLIAIDWYAYIDNLIGFDEDLPPLTGYAEFVPAPETTNAVVAATEENLEKKTGSPLLRNLLAAVGIVVLVMVLFTRSIMAGKK